METVNKALLPESSDSTPHSSSVGVLSDGTLPDSDITDRAPPLRQFDSPVESRPLTTLIVDSSNLRNTYTGLTSDEIFSTLGSMSPRGLGDFDSHGPDNEVEITYFPREYSAFLRSELPLLEIQEIENQDKPRGRKRDREE